MSIREISIEDYQYDLPQDRIAQNPLENRDQSKLLVYRQREISETSFFTLSELLPEHSMLIWNNTKVIPARLQFQRTSGAIIEIFLLDPCIPSGYSAMFNQTGSCVWNSIIGNQKKWKGESLYKSVDSLTGPISLKAEYVSPEDMTKIILSWTPADLPFVRILDLFGKTPIPPYLKRESNEKDKSQYQTVYANFDGSVAAPTAGLHFTPNLIEQLKAKHIFLNPITLHVGSGTFMPVKSKTIGDHQMHAETVIIGKKLIEELLNTPIDGLTVVGTTSLRSLESLFWLGNKLLLSPGLNPDALCVDQWEPYINTNPIGTNESLSTILKFLNDRGLNEIEFITKLIIVPGYHFKLVNRLITNFHQPSSTLLLLVSALIGDAWRDVYNYALSHEFRFLSYGDSSLLEV